MAGKTNQKVLLVEDDTFIAEVYLTKLSADGFETLVARDGEEALAKIKEDRPGIVLLDILMPKMNGIEVVGEMKKDSELKQIPVIILTNANEKEYIEEAQKVGIAATDYLIKSNYTPDEVVEKIKQKLAEEGIG